MKKLCVLISILALSLCFKEFALAHENQGKHDRDLKIVLFGNADLYMRGEKQEVFRAIADAAALCIDQFSPNEFKQNKKGEFEELSKRVQLSMSFEDIDLNKSISGGNITANTHRMYTHKGWNFSEYPNKNLWRIRKKILQETVQQKLFNNNQINIPWLTNVISNLTGPSEQCDAFCAMVYYVHILGDHLEGDKPEKLTALEPLAQYEDLSSPGIIPELQEYMQILFSEQKNSWTFLSLIESMDSLGRKAEKVYYSWGGINDEKKCKINMDNAKELLILLGDNVPKLLRNESFFKQIFI